jgi:thioredoxin-dependent peroxiredoxin
MRLVTNSIAPMFEKSDIFGKKINSQQYIGRKVYLAFFRHAGCPFCNLRIHSLVGIRRQTQNQGLQMIFVTESMKRVITENEFFQRISPIPLLTDPDKELFRLYGLKKSIFRTTLSHMMSLAPLLYQAKRAGVPVHLIAGKESFTTMPAEFLIDEEGIIRELHYSRSLTDRFSLERIIQFASE